MKIECTVDEFKELIKNKTPVAGTTDVVKTISENISSVIKEAAIPNINPLE